jgi:hypothetical protein
MHYLASNVQEWGITVPITLIQIPTLAGCIPVDTFPRGCLVLLHDTMRHGHTGLVGIATAAATILQHVLT